MKGARPGGDGKYWRQRG